MIELLPKLKKAKFACVCIVFFIKSFLLCFPLQSSRVTLKMDVSHTDHSHIIGKGGGNIKRGIRKFRLTSYGRSVH